MKTRPSWAVALAILALAACAACAEKPQSVSSGRSDTQAFQGTGNAYAAAGWQAGDQASWEQQMRSRAQNQNEYSRAGTP